jgi:glycosyltransferase involved in cell wall biosynthesis
MYSSANTLSKPPLVTVVVVFRERFSFALQSLNSILKYRNYPFLLHYHDSDSPPSIRRELEEARDNGELRLFNAGLGTPNQIRNWALSEVSTKYVCFIDNDVLVTDGWIETLVSTAERTEAGIVFPLYLMGELASNRIHMAGGKSTLKKSSKAVYYYEKHRYANASFLWLKIFLKEQPSDFGEFHCMLLRTMMLKEIGGLDEKLCQVNEHLDVALAAKKAGYKIMFQPRSVVSYVYASEQSPFLICDIKPFINRWSHEQAAFDIEYFSKKWNVHSRQNMRKFLNRQINSMPRLYPSSDGDTPAYSAPLTNYEYPYISSFPRLIRQCLDNGHSREEVRDLNKVFDVASALHLSSLRRSKKTFIEHLVRTASILLHHRAPFDLVKAALLHAIYLERTTSANHLPSTAQNRTLIKNIVGNKVEAIVYHYALATRSLLRQKITEPELIGEFPIVRAQAAVVRIANDIEDLLDHAAILEGKNLKIFSTSLALDGILAESCGYHSMVAEFSDRISLAESVQGLALDNSASQDSMIDLLHNRSSFIAYVVKNLGLSIDGLVAKILRKLPRQLLPMRTRLAVSMVESDDKLVQ